MKRLLKAFGVLHILLGFGLSGVHSPSAEAGTILARLGPGHSPQWSPDGKWVSFIKDNYIQVVLAVGTAPPRPLCAYSGNRYAWASSTELVFSESGPADSVYFKKIAVASKDQGDSRQGASGAIGFAEVIESVPASHGAGTVSRPLRLPDGSIGFFRLNGPIAHGPRQISILGKKPPEVPPSVQHLPIIIVDQEASYSVWGDLWIGRAGDSNATLKRITTGKRYGLIEMSPGWDKFVAARMPGGDYSIFDTSGEVLTGRFEPITPGPTPGTREGASRITWSPDGQYLAVVRSVEDSETVLSERLLLTDISNQYRSELYQPVSGWLGTPAWRSDGKAIAIDSERDGIIVLEISP